MTTTLSKRTLLLNLAIAVSFANLWFLPITKIILIGWIDPRSNAFTLNRTYYFAALVCIALITLVITALIMIAQRLDGRRFPAFYSLVLIGNALLIFRRLRKYKILPIGYFADYFSPHMSYVFFAVIALAVFTVIAYVAVRYLHVVTEVAITLFTPFALIIAGQLLWKGITARPLSGWSHTVSSRAPRDSGRVVLMIFDELDRRSLGGARMPGFQSPAFDSLAAHAFVADSAVAPTLSTETAIPSILSGRTVTWTGKEHGEMMVSYNGEKDPVRWDHVPNLFQDLEAAGDPVGVVGWYHSYCSGLAKSVTNCWTPAPMPLPPPDIGLIQTTTRMLHASYMIDVAFGRSAAARESILRTRAVDLVGNTKLRLVYAHFSMPHTPYLRFYKGNGYFGNLTLVDQTIAEVRRGMESAGTWDGATVILTGDHGVKSEAIDAARNGAKPNERSADVPFIVKLPFQKTRAEFTKPFGTVVIADLVPELLAGRIVNAEQLSAWLSARPWQPTAQPTPGQDTN